MTQDKKICSYCNKEFKNGELLIISEGNNYHFIKAYDHHYQSCLTKQGLSIRDINLNTDTHFYYQGKFYSYRKLFGSGLTDLALDINETKNANIIKGDLDQIIDFIN